ncbi:P-loop containing nucleoside triphosphate hydrolase protein [Mycena belliarum]|uniref:ATP-dependent RNA helicase n=1 Tax=Mycena belliarum TaxID=1033014 RepID=A0AAD6XRC6_9AGAR|nr:P-loop containing nucleoside triphosphate hydrolase protein [Mycena belliae]
MAAGMPTAGPSRLRPPKKSKKGPLPLKPGKAKKLSEKQRKEALQREALDYVPPEDLKTFAQLPISDATKRGLKKAFFVDMTEIQTQSLPVSLKGKDVLGAARTGSGKTLSFLVPVLEILYRQKWGATDGLGALIISPTRELAIQIFEVLRSIGGYHSFSAGLVIGGKNLKDERDRLAKMNILVATPGRLLQHMDQTVGFEADNLQILVLDEADRILDMGFSRTLSALLSHLPKSRQTLLFSATQTGSVSDLARLSLNDPVHIGIQEAGGDGATPGTAIPPTLEQHYMTCALDQKLSVLWGFIKTHLQSKVLVFLSSCKQVRFVFETFCRMHPGVPLLHLHGKLKQTARLAMYTKFTTAKHAVLFATDVAARGLDFPAVDWVLQVDAPEDADTYVHRVGRTARYQSKGKALLMLVPSEEEGMLAALAGKGITVEKIKAKMSKVQSIETQLQNLAFQDPEIKYLGQRAFVSYMRSIHLHKDKAIFKLAELPAERFAESLGLPGAPKIKFLSKELAKQKKNKSRAVEEAQAQVLKEKADAEDSGSEDSGDDGEVHESSEEEAEDAKPAKAGVRTKYDRMFERKNQNVLSAHYAKLLDAGDDDPDGEDDFITLKRADHDLAGMDLPDEAADVSKRKQRMGKAKRTMLEGGLGHKIIFDEEGNPHELYEMEEAGRWMEQKGGLRGVTQAGLKFAEGEMGKMRVANVLDKEEAKEKKREKKRKRKEREKAAGGDVGGPMVVGADEEDDGYVSPEFDLPSDSGSDDEETLAPPPAKRSKTAHASSKPGRTAVEDDEELALQLLRQGR